MVRNTNTFEFPCWGGDVGNLVAIEADQTIPFPINRVYYIYDVPPDARRGFHSHHDLEQALICVNGSVKIQVEDGNNVDIVTLDNASKGLYIGPMVWREMFDFTDGAVLLVLASRHYELSDYERDHSEFVRKAKAYFDFEGER